MWNSDSLKLITLTSLLLSAGCLKPGQQEDVEQLVNRHHVQNSQATFYVAREISGRSYDNSSIQGWGIPEQKFYSFRACLADRVTNDRIIGHDFEVITGAQNGQGQMTSTDDEGCLTWDEPVSFNYFTQKAHYLTLERTIRGSGIHRGQFSVTLAINPWRSSRGGNSPEIVDLSKSSLPGEQRLSLQASSEFMGKQFDSKLPLEVKDLSAAVTSRQVLASGNEVDIQLSLTPQVVTTNLLGEKVVHRLAQGEFDVYFQIVGSTTRDQKSDLFPITQNLVASSSAKNDQAQIRFTDNKMDISFRTQITNRITNGHYDLVLRLVPRGISTLGEYYGVYRFAEANGILSSRGSMRPILSSIETPDKVSEFEDKLDGMKGDDLASLAQANADFHQLPPFQFDHMKIAFMRVLPDETTTKRSIAYRSEVCVRRSLDGRLVQHEEFLIKKADGSTEVVNTENEGCFAWIDTITHYYYRPENIMQKTVEVVHSSSGAKSELSAYINPWDYGWTFGQDARKISQEYINDVNNRESVSSQLFISGFRYQTIRFRYEIDKFLNLNVKKSLLLDIAPKVLRYNSITRGRNATEYLRDGVYLMKAAIQKDYYDPRTPGLSLKKHPTIKGQVALESGHSTEVEYISVQEKLVRVKHGLIVTPVEFTVNDLRLMRLRSNFLIELSPIDESILGITPDTNMSNVDLSMLLSGVDSMTLEQRVNPRRESSETFTSGHYISEGQYFSNDPFEVTDNNVETLTREDQRLQRQMPRRLDLDQLIDKDSGLPTRTFVGPVILLSNAFGASMRPTDDLEEYSDCEQLYGEDRQNCLDEVANSNVPDFDNDAQVAKFYGSARHLENISVTELKKRSEKIQLEYVNQQTYDSLISRYVDDFHLDYISMTSQPLKVIPNEKAALETVKTNGEITNFTELAKHSCGSDYIEDCLVDDTSKRKTSRMDLLNHMNFQTQKPWSNFYQYRNMPYFTVNNLMDFIKTGKSDEHMAARLCHTWVYHMMSERVDFNLEEQTRIFRSDWTNLLLATPKETFQFAFANCVREAKKDLSSVFHISQKLRPTKVEGYLFKGGKSMNFNVGANFSLSFGESLRASLDASFDPMSLLKNLGGKIGAVFGVVNVKTGWGASQSRNLGEGTSVSSGTYLAMQKAAMDLYFEEYEPCLEVRMSPEFLSNAIVGRAIGHLPKNKQSEAAHQGLFLCTGQKVKERKPFRENYYYFTQHFTEGDMLDNGDLLNHPWLLAMRGERNYAHFVNLIKATPQTDVRSKDFDVRWLPNNVLKHYLNEGDMVNDINANVDLGERPLDQLIEAYNMMPPTFPGLFTPRPARLDFPN